MDRALAEVRAWRMVFGTAVRPTRDNTAATWLAEGVGGFGTVGGLLPPGFESYLLVEDPLDDEKTVWSEGLEAHTATIADVAAEQTSTPDEAFFAIWEGHGYTLTTAQKAKLRQVDREHRRYHLVTGPVVAASRLVFPHGRWHNGWQQADLWWPADHAWIVGTDIDIWCNYVAGTAELTAAVAATVATPTRLVQRSDWLECGDDDLPPR